MSATIDWAHPHMRGGVSSRRSKAVLRNVLLACGLLYSVLYVFVNDVIAAGMYAGYSRSSQAISELSATSAPTRALLTATLPAFSMLLAAFGVGVWRSADRSRGLRAVGALLIAHAAMAPLWLLAPMTSREQMGTTTSVNDVGHLVLTALTVSLILAQMGFAAAALGKRFRVFSMLMAATVLVFGALTGVASAKIATGEPTPWLGIAERISFGGWLSFMSVLASVLLWQSRARAARPLQRG